MIEASRDARREGARFLLTDNVAECSAIAAHYLLMISQYRDLGDRAGMHRSLKIAVGYVKAAARSHNDLDALDQPVAKISEAAEK